MPLKNVVLHFMNDGKQCSDVYLNTGDVGKHATDVVLHSFYVGKQCSDVYLNTGDVGKHATRVVLHFLIDGKQCFDVYLSAGDDGIQSTHVVSHSFYVGKQCSYVYSNAGVVGKHAVNVALHFSKHTKQRYLLAHLRLMYKATKLTRIRTRMKAQAAAGFFTHFAFCEYLGPLKPAFVFINA